jgi:hypothetical protein
MSFVVCVASCCAFLISGMLFCVICVFVCCYIVVLLQPGKPTFAV